VAAFWIITSLGLLFAVLSALESKVQWIASFCALFGEGCARTQDFRLLRVPISWWGVAYYLVLIAAALFAPPLVMWLVMAGLGFELTFVYTLAALRIMCIFCVLNALTVLGLAVIVFDPQQALPSLAVAGGFLVLSYALIRLENRKLFDPQTDELSGGDLDGSPAMGPHGAPVRIVEFSDYLCPACRSGQPAVRKIRERYADRIQWVFKNHPLPQHPGAELLAEAAHCAGEQDRFWPFHDRAYEVGENPGRQELENIARELGLDVARFRRCLQSGRHRRRIEKDRRVAKDAGVSVTPTFVVNGKRVQGSQSVEDFSALIEKELENPGRP